MVIPIKESLIFLTSILLAIGSTIFLDSKIWIKIALFIIEVVTNFILLRYLSKIKNFKKRLSEKSGSPWVEFFSGVVLVTWNLQVSTTLSFIENVVWIIANSFCATSAYYCVYRIISFLLRKKA
ncbi:hypothetical protein DA798_10910 [Lactobacillus sp. PFC-70]|nr:hypothetical protein DA798_10910 [Lactobacillus sp. PFC-70]